MLGHCIEMYIGDSEAYIGKSLTYVSLKGIESFEKSVLFLCQEELPTTT